MYAIYIVSVCFPITGVFSWITVNYLLGRFDHTSLPGNTEPAAAGAVAGDGDGSHQQHQQLLPLGGSDVNRTVYTITTVGSLDMGGASLQVAFEIPHNVRNIVLLRESLNL